MSVRILDFIAAHDGLRFGEIQREVCRMAGLDYDERRPTRVWNPWTTGDVSIDGPPFTVRLVRRWRGYWCTALVGNGQNLGLLGYFCTKGPDGRWRRNIIPHAGRPWTLVNSRNARAFRDAALGMTVPDWRPTESIPEDHYAV